MASVSGEVLGLEVLDGEEMEHLTVQLDFPTLWAALTDEQKADINVPSLNPDLTPEIESRLYRLMEVQKLEMWIDERGYQRRTTMQMAITGIPPDVWPEDQRMFLDFRVSNINQPVTIDPPKELVESSEFSE